MMYRFKLERDEDVSGISGRGSVAEGVQLEDGRCVLNWIVGEEHSVAIYSNIPGLMSIVGHNGRTRLIWIDRPPIHLALITEDCPGQLFLACKGWARPALKVEGVELPEEVYLTRDGDLYTYSIKTTCEVCRRKL